MLKTLGYSLVRFDPAIVRSLPFAIYIVFLAIGPWLSPLLPDGRWLYALQVGLVAIVLGFLAMHYGELRQRFPQRGELMSALAVGLAVFVLWINLDQAGLSFGGGKGFDPTTAAGNIDWPLAVVRIFGAAGVVPVMEELFWRSFIMRWIDRTGFLELSPRQVTWRGVVISSLLFGVEHSMWFAGILAGLAYGLLYKRQGNLWAPVLAHAVTNLLLGLWVLQTGNWQFW